jgi:hypothetical protein
MIIAQMFWFVKIFSHFEEESDEKKGVRRG